MAMANDGPRISYALCSQPTEGNNDGWPFLRYEPINEGKSEWYDMV